MKDAGGVRLDDVWSAAESVAAKRNWSVNAAMAEWGLVLEIPPKRWDYFCTPHNSVTFASTGGDGVHFGLLSLPGRADQPVVMTVPISDQYNTVVAESLQEFLELGYHVGWFSLEEIIYSPEDAEAYFAAHDPESWPEHTEDLASFRDRLGLHHRPLKVERLRTLQAKYLPFVIADDYPPDDVP